MPYGRIKASNRDRIVFYISVYGRSGSGKSIVVKFVCENLDEDVSYALVNLREAGQWKISKMIDFEEKYFSKNNEDRKLPDFLGRAMNFILVLAETTEKGNLLSAYRDHESVDTNVMTPEKASPFKKLLVMLQIISDDLSDVTQLPSTIPQNKRITENDI